MSNELDTVTILETCIQHTIKYSLTHFHPSVRYCHSRVIPLAAVQSMLSKDFPIEAYIIVKHHTTLQNFFEYMLNTITDETKARLKWIFKVMDYDEYQSDCRVFPPIKEKYRLDDNNKLKKLFVVYRVDDVENLRDYLRDNNDASVLTKTSNILLSHKGTRNIEKDPNDIKQCEDQVEECEHLVEQDEQGSADKNQINTEKKDDDTIKDKENQENVGVLHIENRDYKRNKKERYIDEQSALTEELQNLNQILAISKQSYAARASVIDRINYMLNNIWGITGSYVTAYGSTMNGLGTDKTNLDLCIVIPYLKQICNDEKRMLKLLPNSVFNMNSVAAYLQQIGMFDIQAVNTANVPICKFTDPFTGLHCDINTNNFLGIESSQLIIQYMSLDVRVRPFLFALKFFVVQMDICNTRAGTLSTYAYLLIGLHYLMYIQEPPVIPSLQSFKGTECNSPTCRVNSNLSVDDWSVTYHDCIVIENMKNGQLSITDNLNENSTLWPSQNAKSIGELFLGFLEHYSSKRNLFRKMSITEPSSEMKDIEEWKEHKAVVRDPFDLRKNTAYSVTEFGGRVICKEFERAFNMLKNGTYSFRQVIESKDTVERPSFDPDSLDTRYGANDNSRYVDIKITIK